MKLCMFFALIWMKSRLTQPSKNSRDHRRQWREVTKVDHWGKRRLAFEVQKLREGYYVLCYFTADADLPKELERNFKISDEVIRFLVVREGE